MGGKGNLVKYTRKFKKGPLTKKQKQSLKDDINAIIDGATNAITIEAMVGPSADDLRKELKKKGG